MANHNAILTERTTDFFVKTKDNIIHLQNAASDKLNAYSDEEKFIILSIDKSLLFHSITISDSIYNTCEKKEIITRITNLVNRAIIKSSIIGADEIKNAVSMKEFAEIIANESQEIKEGISKLQDKFIDSLKQLTLTTKTIISDNGNITVVISGDKMIQSISVSDEYLSSDKKAFLETELLQAVNKAIQEIQKEMQIIFNINEKEIKKTLLRE